MGKFGTRIELFDRCRLLSLIVFFFWDVDIVLVFLSVLIEKLSPKPIRCTTDAYDCERFFSSWSSFVFTLFFSIATTTKNTTHDLDGQVGPCSDQGILSYSSSIFGRVVGPLFTASQCIEIISHRIERPPSKAFLSLLDSSVFFEQGVVTTHRFVHQGLPVSDSRRIVRPHRLSETCLSLEKRQQVLFVLTETRWVEAF